MGPGEVQSRWWPGHQGAGPGPPDARLRLSCSPFMGSVSPPGTDALFTLRGTPLPEPRLMREW